AAFLCGAVAGRQPVVRKNGGGPARPPSKGFLTRSRCGMMMAFDAEKFVAEQRTLVAEEHDAEVAQKQALLGGCSQAELQRPLYNVHVTSVRTGFRGKTVVDVEPVLGGRDVFPAHRIRVGDLVAIEPASAHAVKSGKTRKGVAPSTTSIQAGRVTGVVSKVADARLSVVVGADDDISDALSCKCRVLKGALEDLRLRIVQPAKLGPLARVLLRQEKPTICSDGEDNVRFHDLTLNDSQKDAIRFALRADVVALIHGPPGTGKTFTLVELIRQLADRGKRMLVCGPSNVSVGTTIVRDLRS
ncbi:MAG: AAA domain-containing protein, partial [Olpidium bornovanus]